MENYVNRPLSDKSMKFCIVVVHDLTNDIKARSHQRPDQPPLSPALEKWTDRQWAGLDRGERMLV